MSEYQYYEFQAVDRPLDRRAMAELREITSRAEITPTRMVNEYHFGSFKGKPEKLCRLPGRVHDAKGAQRRGNGPLLPASCERARRRRGPRRALEGHDG